MATITENLQTIKDSTMAIKQAIIDKGGEVGDLTTYASAIANLPSGGGDVNPTASKNDVTFYDYDGTIRYSYTAAEFLALTEMPPLPRQQGLICQEWNWSFEDAIEYVAEYGVLDVGATYITDDGKTRLYIRIAAEGRMDVPLYFQQTVANGVTIDWGDGSATETLEGTGKVNTTHRYASIGDYMIGLDVAEGCTLMLGHNSTSISVIGGSNSSYKRMLYKAEIGAGITSLSCAFTGMKTLASVTIPKSINTSGNTAFLEVTLLSCVIIPNGITNISGEDYFRQTQVRVVSLPRSITTLGSIFRSCECLSTVVIPPKITEIAQIYCYLCYGLVSLVFPKGITTIGANSFAYCSIMAFYDFSHLTAVPTLANTNAFTSIPSDCKIIVPDNLYDTWIAATNWSTYASHIIKKTDWDASINNQ